jgi:predicted GNAT superfamily acetyltransferase
VAGSQDRKPVIEIQPLRNEQQFRGAVELQKVIWGFEDIELLPVRFFVVATKVGGQAFGAFDGDRMVAFCMAIPGLKPGGKSYLHSHMLGVLPEYRDFGLGRRLKLRQRDDALAAGIELIEWTFDPLETKNAYFNIERLGAVVRRYVRNQYGTTTSHLHGGLPTDRCTAEWWIGSERVRRVIAGEALERAPIVARIAVPADMGDDRRKVQESIANQFEAAFDKGFTVTGVERTPDAGTYLLADLPKNECHEN